MLFFAQISLRSGGGWGYPAPAAGGEGGARRRQRGDHGPAGAPAGGVHGGGGGEGGRLAPAARARGAKPPFQM
eukprot:1182771-Prorocentrum_minimum.AAC.1